ncbi:hypothetical protein G6F46_003950 [Rhizopus delemar]|nr:hypothetical protein G6F55_002726 [Rhizopus delemar]KAG1547645.1 hypothetical protein G6F51_004142 [Rhizopus arrhizus]KAG1494268.1 hypothetical protein G6F53_012602 [Rhizopus delemar]KAG1500963.1 hypothetical protein G6F54_003358 [Rhizopus delemar]KAG1526966.1 hypothetical protein G6F52_001960 [Rhizopus delemar]
MNSFIQEDGMGNIFNEEGGQFVEMKMEVDEVNYPLDNVTNFDQYNDEELEFCKLCLSSTVSFVSPKIDSMLKSLLPEHLYLEAKMASEAQKVSLVCPPEIATLAKKIVEGLTPFENDRDTGNCVMYLDKAKYEELDKTSTNYQLLCITEKVIRAIDVLKKSGKVRESFWVRKFIEVVEVLLTDTDFVVSDGESVCNDTRAASSGSVFGRRVDLLVSVSEGGTAINLASFEAKKGDAVVSSQLYQQIKNHRINAAILNRANCLLGTTDHSCIYMDIVGSSGYFMQLSRKDDYLICQPLVNFRMATNLIEIDYKQFFN